jgi:hypothetical protein
MVTYDSAPFGPSVFILPLNNFFYLEITICLGGTPILAKTLAPGPVIPATGGGLLGRVSGSTETNDAEASAPNIGNRVAFFEDFPLGYPCGYAVKMHR